MTARIRRTGYGRGGALDDLLQRAHPERRKRILAAILGASAQICTGVSRVAGPAVAMLAGASMLPRHRDGRC